MTTRWSRCGAVVAGLILAAVSPFALSTAASAAEAVGARALVVAGPCTHPPGTHEAAAGARLIEYILEHAEGAGPLRADVISEWPSDAAALGDVATVVFIGDIFPGETMADPARIKADLAEMMKRGCGIVCIHYATGLRAQHVAEDGDHPLLRWLGGYFATGCKHHRSVARVLTSTIEPAGGDHPVLRGWKTFTFDDEPYWNNYFGPDGPAENVTPIAVSMLPPDEPKREIIAWAVQRADGGRGVGMVIPHYFRSWKIDDLRTLALNAICWSAQLDVPPDGVKATLPDLATFAPDSVEPQPRPQKQPKKAVP